MKKILPLVITSLFVTPALSFASGLHCSGYVSVSTSSTGTTYIAGTPNIRWDATPTTVSEYIYVGGYANSTITIMARNDDGTYGSCYIPTTSPLYDDAQHMRRQNGDGLYIYTYKTSASNECRALYTQSHSCRLH